MLLNATRITTPEAESYPDLPASLSPSLYPPGFPMPTRPAAAAVVNTPAPPQQPAPAPPIQASDNGSSGVFGDPPHIAQDVPHMKDVTPSKIVAAYRWMGVKILTGKAEGNVNWQACEGGAYNIVTGHWREHDEHDRYRLLSIFQIAVREGRFESMDDARKHLFNTATRPASPTDKTPRDVTQPAAATVTEVEVTSIEQSDANGTIAIGIKGELPKDPVLVQKTKDDCAYNIFPGCKDNAKESLTVSPATANLVRLSSARLLLEAAQDRMRETRTHFGFAQALTELDMAISNVCEAIIESEQAAKPGPVEHAKPQSSEIPKPKYPDPEKVKAESAYLIQGMVAAHEQNYGFPSQEMPVAPAPAPVPSLEISGDPYEVTIESMGIAKGTCNLLKKVGVATFGDIVEQIGSGQDWMLLTQLPGIGKAKVDSIRGACEKLMEGHHSKKSQGQPEGSG